MDAAWLLIAHRRRRGLPPAADALLDEPAPSELQFAATDHMAWRNPRNTVAVAAWQRSHPFAGGGPRWKVDERGVAVCVGFLWTTGMPWTPESAWPDLMRDRLDDSSASSTRWAAIGGLFAGVAADRDGRAVAVNDPLGFRFIYYGTTRDTIAIGTTAAVVARALAAPGVEPRRDPLGACWLAHTRHVIGDRSGYDGVRVLRPGRVLRVAPGKAFRVEHPNPPWLPRGNGPLDVEARLDEVREHIAATLSSALTIPSTDHVIDLTGGKDSRAVLGVTMHAGLADRFAFRTVGPKNLGDVQASVRIADDLGLRHQVEYPLPGPEGKFADFTGFVRRTSGLVSMWDARPPVAANGVVRVQGIPGEMLRCYRAPGRPLDTVDSLVDFVTQQACKTRLDLARPEAAARYNEMATEVVRDDGLDGLRPMERLHAFYFGNRVRFLRFGALAELNPDLRVLPLYSMPGLRLAIELGEAAREDQYIHFRLVRDASEALAKEPFAGEGWPERVTAGEADADDYRTVTPVLWTDRKENKSEALVARLQREATSQRVETLREIFLDADNAAWDVLDRGRALDALARFDSLPMGARQELYGAATAVVWLGSGERHNA